jgi:hypothetical protein
MDCSIAPVKSSDEDDGMDSLDLLQLREGDEAQPVASHAAPHRSMASLWD